MQFQRIGNQHKRKQSHCQINPNRIGSQLQTGQNNTKSRKLRSAPKSKITSVITQPTRSARKAKRRRVIIDSIDKEDEVFDDTTNQFFCFGKRKPIQRFPQQFHMEEIRQVPDTVSNSQRYTECLKQPLGLFGRQASFWKQQNEMFKQDESIKQNLCMNDNKEDDENKQEVCKENDANYLNSLHLPLNYMNSTTNGKILTLKNCKLHIPNLNCEHYSNTKQIKSHRQSNHNSRKGNPQSRRSQQFSQSRSTISLSRRKSKGKINIKMERNNRKNSSVSNVETIGARTERIERSMRMIWQCMGELWESSRISRYMSEQTQQKIEQLKQRQQERESKLLAMKGCEIKKIQSLRY